MHKWFLVFIGILGTVQIPIVIACRNHYTVDVVAALWIAPLLWHFISREIHPKDLDAWKADTVCNNLFIKLKLTKLTNWNIV